MTRIFAHRVVEQPGATDHRIDVASLYRLPLNLPSSSETEWSTASAPQNKPSS